MSNPRTSHDRSRQSTSRSGSNGRIIAFPEKGSLRNRRADLSQTGPFPIGMNDIAPPRLPPRRGMDDGVAMVLVLKRGEEK
jgi:hypothetical protein